MQLCTKMHEPSHITTNIVPLPSHVATTNSELWERSFQSENY